MLLLKLLQEMFVCFLTAVASDNLRNIYLLFCFLDVTCVLWLVAFYQLWGYFVIPGWQHLTTWSALWVPSSSPCGGLVASSNLKVEIPTQVRFGQVRLGQVGLGLIVLVQVRLGQIGLGLGGQFFTFCDLRFILGFLILRGHFQFDF